jgi:hypothetical protein
MNCCFPVGSSFTLTGADHELPSMRDLSDKNIMIEPGNTEILGFNCS